MSSTRLKLRDPRELLASPSDSNDSAPAMADATAVVPTSSPIATSRPSEQPTPPQKTQVEPPSPQPSAKPNPEPRSGGSPVSANERRESEPVPKKRRLLEATEAADTQEEAAPNKPVTDGQDILAKACFAVGIDSDLADSVVEEPLPPPQEGSHHILGGPQDTIHYVQEIRPPYPGVPADVRLRRPEVRIHPGMHHHVEGSFPVGDPRLPFHQIPPRFHDPHYAVARRLPMHADPRHYRPPPPSHPRYQYVPCPRPVTSPIPRTILVSERGPPPRHPVMHHDPRHPRPPAMHHDPRNPPPSVIHHDPRHPTHPSLQHNPRLPPPEYHRAGRMVPEVRHMAPAPSEVRYRVPVNHHEVAIVSPQSSPPVPAQGKLERPPHGDHRARPYEMYTSPPGSAHIQKESTYAPVSPHGRPGHYGPPHMADQYKQHSYMRTEMGRDQGQWQGQATPPSNAPIHHSLDNRAPLPVRSPQVSPQDNAWAAKRPAETQEKTGEFMTPRRLQEPKPCVELIPLRAHATHENEKNDALHIPSSPGYQKNQTAAPVTSATVTPVNRKTSEHEAPSEKYPRLNHSTDSEFSKTSRGSSGFQVRSQSLPTPETETPPVPHNVIGRRAISADASIIDSNNADEQRQNAKVQPSGSELRSENALESEGRLETVTVKNTPRETSAENHSMSASQSLQDENGRFQALYRNSCAVGPGQLHILHSSQVVGQDRSASEPPPGVAGRTANPMSALRPASLPAATQICATNRAPQNDSVNMERLKMNGEENPTEESNSEGDEIFIERLRLVLDDLVSVPEASLPKESHSPQQLLAYLVRQGGGKPSTDLCLRQRLRQDFLTVVKRCMPRNILSDWGWDSCTPEQILDQLIKVSSGGEEGINGGEQPTRPTISTMQDEPLEDDVFTQTSTGALEQRNAPVHPSHSTPSPVTQSAPSAVVSCTPVTRNASPHALPQNAVTPEIPIPRKEVPLTPVPCSSKSQTPSPQIPTPKTSPNSSISLPSPSVSHASAPNISTTQTSAAQIIPHPTSPRQEMNTVHTTVPYSSTNYTAVPCTSTTRTTSVYVSATQSTVPYTYNHTEITRDSSVTTVANTSKTDTIVPRTPTTHSIISNTAASHVNITHGNSNNVRTMSVSPSYPLAPHSGSVHTCAPPAYSTYATSAQTRAQYTSAPHSLPVKSAPSPAVSAAVQHSHPSQNFAPTSVVSPGNLEPRARHPAAPMPVSQPSVVQSVPSGAGMSDPHYTSRERMLPHGAHLPMPLVPARPPQPPQYHPGTLRHPTHPAHPRPSYQTYNHHAPVHPPAGNPSHHPNAHPPGGHPQSPVLMPGGQNPHYPRQPPHLYHQPQHHLPAHYQYAHHQYAQHQAHSTKKWTG